MEPGDGGRCAGSGCLCGRLGGVRLLYPELTLGGRSSWLGAFWFDGDRNDDGWLFWWERGGPVKALVSDAPEDGSAVGHGDAVFRTGSLTRRPSEDAPLP